MPSQMKLKLDKIKKKNKSKKKEYYNTFKIKKVTGERREKQWCWTKQIKSDFYMKKNVKYIRTVWAPTYYSKNKLKKEKTHNELYYWRHDIDDEKSDDEGGIWITWKDSYIPEHDKIV